MEDQKETQKEKRHKNRHVTSKSSSVSQRDTPLSTQIPDQYQQITPIFTRDIKETGDNSLGIREEQFKEDEADLDKNEGGGIDKEEEGVLLVAVVAEKPAVEIDNEPNK